MSGPLLVIIFGLLCVPVLAAIERGRRRKRRESLSPDAEGLAALKRMAINARTSEPRLARHPLGGPSADLGLLPRRSPTSRSRSAPTTQRKA